MGALDPKLALEVQKLGQSNMSDVTGSQVNREITKRVSDAQHGQFYVSHAGQTAGYQERAEGSPQCCCRCFHQLSSPYDASPIHTHTHSICEPAGIPIPFAPSVAIHTLEAS